MSSPQNHQAIILARGGGGGSSSGGGGGGSSSSSSSSHSSSSSSGSSSSAPGWVVWLFIFGFVGIWILIMVFSARAKKNSGGSVPAGFTDANKLKDDNQKVMAERANEVFMKFQQAWSEFDLKAMKSITAPAYYAKMALELNVLRNYGRQNLMENTKILGSYLGNIGEDTFQVFFRAQADDKLMDTKENKLIFSDSSVFTEIWTFAKVGKDYVLDRIDQTTAEASKFDEGIAQFATSNGYFYDPDFGWLMMPSRGAIFGPAGFGNADINNHVMGSYGKANKQKIVEFYSYEPKAGAGMTPITVAQAILPKHYSDILVTEKSWYDFKPKLKGLTKVETESVDFNKKFSVWAADVDKATSFELLATNFMERIYKLDFEVNIEVVDNVLYLYSPDHKPNYAEMQEVLSWAFEEMKL